MSCYNLGTLYNKGQGVKQDYYKAAQLWEKGCDSRDDLSCYNLGILYEKGQGVGRDYHMAKELFRKACDLGLQPGCDFYKKLNEKGF
ncbi:tetratricopeptide repeat protein [Campylobacter concisus]|nr:tetratricopeptide repeat protein [Campylobacter concisus]